MEKLDSLPGFLHQFKAAIGLSTPRVAPKPLKTYGSIKKRKLSHEYSVDASPEPDAENAQPAHDAAPKASFADSAYQSMTTTLDNGSDREIESTSRMPSKDSRRPTKKVLREKVPSAGADSPAVVSQTPKNGRKRKLRSPSREGEEDELASPGKAIDAQNSSKQTYSGPAVPEDVVMTNDDEPEPIVNATTRDDSYDRSDTGDVIVVRTSGRERKKTRKQLAEEEAAAAMKSKLTPTLRRKRGRPKKNPSAKTSVGKAVEPLHFDDIPTQGRAETASSKKRGKRKSVQDDVEAVAAFVEIQTPTKDPEISSIGPDRSIVRKPVPGSATKVWEIEDKVEVSSYHFRELSELLRDSRYAESFADLKTEVLEGLTRKRRLPLVGLEDEYQKIHQLVEQTIVAAEGNSMLIIGARGTAKTTLVETVVAQLAVKHCEDFHVVRLNGFLHTDDKIALKEIWRQLGKEMEVEENTSKAPSNYSDTLLSLLALLSHPAELSDTVPEAEQTSKSVVFIIDEFDLFTTHARQTLLYNLFDIAQSRKAPIAVLGLTTKIDVVESLEKRVKSRFSHRYVYLPWPKTFGVYQDICKAALLCHPSEESSRVCESLTDLRQKRSTYDHKLRIAWSNYMDSLLSEDPGISQFLRCVYARSKSVPTFLSACILPIASMSVADIPTSTDIISNSVLPPDSKLQILFGLSELELALLIAAARLDIILDTDTCNFNMAYDEYKNLASRMKIQSSASGAAALGSGARVWGREVAMGAWEKLEGLDLLVPLLGAGGGGGMADVGRSGKLWKVDVALEEIGASGVEMSVPMSKWCREI